MIILQALIFCCAAASFGFFLPRSTVFAACFCTYAVAAVLFAHACCADGQEAPPIIWTNPESDFASDKNSCLSEEDPCKTFDRTARVYNALYCPNWSRCYR
jgi:hypothetical protein